METKKSTEIGDIQSRREETDYANRKRNREWRQDWFYRIRPQGDKELIDVWQRGLRPQATDDRQAAQCRRPSGRLRAGGRRVALVHHRPAKRQWASQGARRSPHGSRHRLRGRRERRRVEEHRRRPVVAAALGRAGHDGLRCPRDRAERARHDLCRHRRVDAGGGPGLSRHGCLRQHRRRRHVDAAHLRVSRRVAQILVSPTDASRVYVAGESGFERSTDAGVTWTTVRAGRDLRCRNRSERGQHALHQRALRRHLQDDRRRNDLDEAGRWRSDGR